MNKRKLKGFISVELVIVAALILSVGTIGVVSLGTSGSAKMEQALNQLDASTTINETTPNVPATKVNWYDENGYDIELNVNPTDINPISDFTLTLNTEKDGWVITGYTNVTDKTVVIPKYHTDGLPIVEIAYASFYQKALTDIALPNSIKIIGESAFGGNEIYNTYKNNNFVNLYIPESATNIGKNAFYESNIDKLIFRGTIPSIGTMAFDLVTLSTGSIQVPAEYYDGYNTFFNHGNYIVIGYNNYWKLDDKPYNATWYDKELTINATDINPLSNFIFNFNYITQDYTIVAYTNTTDKTVIIPKYYTDGLPIAKIEKLTFYQKTLTDIVLPNSIKTIGESAFGGNEIYNTYKNNNFATVYIPKSVTNVGNNAFYESNIDKLIFRGTIPSIGTMAFDLVTLSPGRVLVPAEYYDEYNAFFKYSNDVLVGYNNNWSEMNKPYDGTWYDKDLTINAADINPLNDFVFKFNNVTQDYTIVAYTNATDKTVIIPKYYTDGLPIAEIEKSIFYQKTLTDIVLPNSIKTIGESAFGGSGTYNTSKNNNFATVYIPDSVINIGNNAFYVSNIDNLIFRGAIPSIGTNAFTLIALSNGRIQVPAEYYDAYNGFFKYSNNVVIGYNNQWVAANQPYNGTWYDKDLTINTADINPLSDFIFNFNYITQDYTIVDYTNTTDKTVIIPKYYTDGLPIAKIEKSTFYQETLTDIVLPNSIKTIGELAFGGNASTNTLKNNNFSTVYIPESVTNIGNSAFYVSKINKLIFRGPAPTVGTNTISMEITTAGSILVPSEHYDAYYSIYPYSYMAGY